MPASSATGCRPEAVSESRVSFEDFLLQDLKNGCTAANGLNTRSIFPADFFLRHKIGYMAMLYRRKKVCRTEYVE